MTRIQLIEKLRTYLDVCTRIDVLTLRLRKKEDSFAVLSDEGIEGAQLLAKPITDMPIHHGMTGSTVERVAALREKAQKCRMADLKRDAAELAALLEDKEKLDILQRSLGDRERFVIRMHLINRLSWRDTGHRYAMTYVDELTVNALKYIMTQALDRMLHYAAEVYSEDELPAGPGFPEPSL